MDFEAVSCFRNVTLQHFGVHDVQPGAHHVMGQFEDWFRGRIEEPQRPASHKSLSLSFQNFWWNVGSQGAPHEGPAVTGTHELIARNGVQKFEEITI